MIDLPPSPAPAIIVYEPLMWQEGDVIRVLLLDGDPATNLRIEAIEAGPDGWNSASSVQIVFVDALPAEVRVSFVEGVSWSYLGRSAFAVAPPEPTMNLGWAVTASDDSLRALWLHEMGHALGFKHPDGDDPTSIMVRTGVNNRLSDADKHGAAEVYGEPPPPACTIYFPLVVDAWSTP